MVKTRKATKRDIPKILEMSGHFMKINNGRKCGQYVMTKEIK